MVSSISGNSGMIAMQQMMIAAMQKKMQEADTDGKQGLSKEEISSVEAINDKGGSHFLNALSQNFDKIDGDGDGQLSKDEIKAAEPSKPPMGPPPGMMMQGPPPSGDAESALTETYDELDTNEDGEVSIQERIAGQDAEKDSSQKTGLSETKSNSGLSSYAAKLLSNYQKGSSESLSSFDFVA